MQEKIYTEGNTHVPGGGYVIQRGAIQFDPEEFYPVTLFAGFFSPEKLVGRARVQREGDDILADIEFSGEYADLDLSDYAYSMSATSLESQEHVVSKCTLREIRALPRLEEK